MMCALGDYADLDDHAHHAGACKDDCVVVDGHSHLKGRVMLFHFHT